MEMSNFPGCCTSNIMYGFGNGRNCDYTTSAAYTKEQALEFIRSQCRTSRAMGKANLVMILNNDQEVALDAIDEIMAEETTHGNPLSIIYTPWMKSNNHLTLIRTYIFQLRSECSDAELRMAGVSNE